MIGYKAGSMTFQETSKPIDSGKYGLPAMDTHTVGSGKLLGYDVQSRAAFTAHMRPDGSWVGSCLRWCCNMCRRCWKHDRGRGWIF